MFSAATVASYRPTSLSSFASQPPISERDHRIALHQDQFSGELLLDHYKPRSASGDAASSKSGLRTPPSEGMGTTYQVPNLASYENHHVHHSAYASTLSNEARSRSATENGYDSASAGYPSSSQIQHQQPQRHGGAAKSSASSQPSTSRRSATPSTPRSSTSHSDQATSARDAAMVLHSLQIPTCISPKGGNLADFTAQITCLFWFESIKTLEAAEQLQTLSPMAPIRRLTENAVPMPNFRKWVHTVLSTTQVTQNVILLALMFIYRLKVANANVKGRAGSEYRLLTVALMLGNKFLDDNTYTNKTWAEVSGISVGEIHVMEVEFLSNMRYSLLASKEQWEQWLAKLANFWEYCDRAQRPPVSPLTIPSPAHRNGFGSPLPSPTGTVQLTPSLRPTPPPAHTYSPTIGPFSSSAHQTPWHPAYPAGGMVSPLALKPDLHSGLRKRSYPEDESAEPPAKRISRQLQPLQQPQLAAADAGRPQPSHQRAGSNAMAETIRLPVPNLSLNTPTLPSTITQSNTNSYMPQQTSGLSLPPLVPGTRAMATVFPPSTGNTFAPQLPHPATTLSGATLPASATAAVATPPRVTTTSFAPGAYGAPAPPLRTSPQSSLRPGAGPGYTSSPMAENYAHLTPMGGGGGSGVHTPISSHSPSVYLQQRPSPYKPVRHVTTLLYPPPSAFLHDQQQQHAHRLGATTPGGLGLAPQFPPARMLYQPLGRRNEFRSGVVPEFALAAAAAGGAGSGIYGGGRHHAHTPAPMGAAAGGLQPPPPSHGQPGQAYQQPHHHHGQNNNHGQYGGGLGPFTPS